MPLFPLNNWRLLFGGGLALAALLAIGVQTVRLTYAQAALAKSEGVVSMLRGSIANYQSVFKLQNAAIADYARRTEEAQKASQAAQQASARLHANDDARIAALLARHPATTLDAACRAADAAILEFAK